MKKYFSILLSLVLGFALGTSSPKLKEGIKTYLKHKKYRIAKRCKRILENKPFVIIIMSYNNASYVEKNLLSVLSQDYDNYHILYIDDASTDGTKERVKQIIEKHDPRGRIRLIENRENRGAMHNLYHAVHACKNGEIVVTVDGDDFLAHPYVLQNLNAYYANPNVWLTYGNYEGYTFHSVEAGLTPEENTHFKGLCRPLNLKALKKGGIRAHPFVTSALRTFYAGLFKRIKRQDFLHEGKFFSIAYDVACMLPMIELAEGHEYFIEEVLYLYNLENPISDFIRDRQEQVKIERLIRSLPSYSPLKEHPKEEVFAE